MDVCSNSEDSMMSPVQEILITGVSIMKIGRHVDQEKEENGSIVKGVLYGCLVDDVLEITNAVPLHNYDDDESFNESLVGTGLDYVHVGFYVASINKESVYTNEFISEQFDYQKKTDNFVFVVYDSEKVSTGTIDVKAYRLSTKFMLLYKENKFSLKDLVDIQLPINEILSPLEVSISNSKFISFGLYELDFQLSQQHQSNNHIGRNYVAIGELDKRYAALIEKEDNTSKLNDNFRNLSSNNESFLSLMPSNFLKETLHKLITEVEEVAKESHTYSNYQKSLQKSIVNRRNRLEKCVEQNRLRHERGERLMTETEILRICQLPSPPPHANLVSHNIQINAYVEQMNNYAKLHIKKLLLSQSLMCGYSSLE
ncbi:hypothetical protein A3Q56_00522 [Intoshia linei]|uniref:Uncharacterized protein n=1 Tax=Intoshia linei TaxID=1819745 RepID=A0A177BBR3_9BILA|nr:hypothetical protein A3Q56_00522 [Intoshia linei]